MDDAVTNGKSPPGNEKAAPVNQHQGGQDSFATSAMVTGTGVVVNSTGSDSGYVKLHRSAEAERLLSEHPKAFLLLAQIALRAHWKPGVNSKGLRQGQALVGDFKSIGFSEKEYRTAKTVLDRLGFVTFAGFRRKGTIATLKKQTIFDLNLGWVDQGRKKGGKEAESRADNSNAGNGSKSGAPGDCASTKGGTKGEKRAEKGRTTKNISKESKGGASAPASVGAGAPTAVADSPSGSSTMKPLDRSFGGLKPEVVE